MDATSDPISIVRCDAAREKGVLATAAQSWPESERAAYWRSIGEAARSAAAGDVVLLAAYAHEQLVAAQVAQALAGRAAVVWAPQFATMPAGQRDELTRRMFDRTWRELATTDAVVAQALADPRDPHYAELLATGGLRLAADLIYMAAGNESFPTAPVAMRLALEPFAVGDDDRLIRLIDRTYIGTLDCPTIDGLRQTADVVAGYRAVGDFDPARWLFARQEGMDAGCLLVNVHSDLGHAEIVYLGIVPEMRGRGYGLDLTRHALWLARQAACERAVLAVDGNNQPAVEMYKAAGFVPFDHRSVWFRTLV